MKISVSFLKEKDNYKEVINKIQNTSADFIHIDVLDGTYISEESIEFNKLKEISYSKKIDVHLMSSDLDNQINNYSKLNPEYITIHLEVGDTLKYIDKIKKMGIKVGLAISPDTKVSEIYPYLDKVDLILILSVYPGKGGQTFIENTTNKLKELNQIKKSYNFLVEVDGGINEDNFNLVKDYIDIAVVGSYITDSENYEVKIKNLKSN